MSSAVNDPYTYQNGCLETPEQWHDLGFDEPKSFYLSGVWHYPLMNFTILSQENPQMQGFGTQWTLWCTQAWNICIAIMNQVAFPASDLLQLPPNPNPTTHPTPPRTHPHPHPHPPPWRHRVMVHGIDGKGSINPLRPRQNGRHFADDTLNRIFLNENVKISIKISLKFVPWGPINNIPALVQIMAWRRPGDKPLSEPMMVSFTDAYMRHSASMS